MGVRCNAKGTSILREYHDSCEAAVLQRLRRDVRELIHGKT